jgi:hypothetical protein
MFELVVAEPAASARIAPHNAMAAIIAIVANVFMAVPRRTSIVGVLRPMAKRNA